MASPFRTMVLTATLLLLIFTTTTLPHAKEIVGTNEWQLIGENDTLPAGLHIKMDLSTGERWARLVQEDDDGAVQDAVDADAEKSAALIITEDQADDGGEETDAPTEEIKPQRDYEMMHRVMSSLPPEELERFGGLPALPVPKKQADDKEAVLSISPQDLAAFEARMEELWTLRQEELRKFQEEALADVPTLLKDRIEILKAYVTDPVSSREEVLSNRAQQQEQQNDNEVDAGEDLDESNTVNDIIECLKDLEYQLSDIDHARDFHTLGGWSYLVLLLDEQVHMINCNDGPRTDREIMYEIQSLAAMAIGTAVGNLEEFHSWALEDVSNNMNVILMDPNRVSQGAEPRKTECDRDYNLNSDGPISALFSLANSFESEVDRRSLPTTQSSELLAQSGVKNVFRTYKLRAVYALGSLLRGNVEAQQHFVSKNGPDVLVRYVLGSLSSVNGDKGVTKLDYKLASKVLALGEDVVMDVLLHEEDYTKSEMGKTSGLSVSPNQIVAGFTTEPWCDLSIRMLSPPIQLLGESQTRSMKEKALSAIRAIGPACKENAQQSVCSSSDGSQECIEESFWGMPEVLHVRAEWNREGSGDGLDSVYRRELLDLVDGVIEVLR